MMTWNSNPFWYPRNREANSIPIAHRNRPDQYWWLTVTHLLLSTKVNHNKLSTIIAWLWEWVLQWQNNASIEFSLMVFEPRMIHTPPWKITIWTSTTIIIEAHQTWEIIIIDDKRMWTLTWIKIMNKQWHKRSLLLT